MKHRVLAAALATVLLCASPVSAQMPPYAGNSYYWVEDAIKNMTTRGMSKEQIGAQFKQYGIDLTGSTIDAVLSGALGTDTNIATKVITALRWGNVSSLQNDLVQQGYLLAEDLIEQYTPSLVGLLSGGICSSMVMDGVATAASAISGYFSGGRATVVAQLAQQIQLAWANKCNGEMNDSLRSLAEYERKNISNGSVNGIPGINGMISRLLPKLGLGGFLSNEDQVQDQYERRYPNAFGPMDGQSLETANIIWDNQSRTSQLTSMQIENRAVQEQNRALNRAKDFAAAGRDGPGIRAELQAMNAIGGEQIAAINNMTAATIGAQRAQTEVQMRNDARKTAANATAENFMSTLTTCSDCTISRPFLGN